MKSHKEIKAKLNFIYGIFDKIEETKFLTSAGNTPYRNVFRADFLQYLLYLAGADGSVASEECDFLNYLFDFNNSEIEYEEFIRKIGANSSSVEDKVHNSLMAIATMDLQMAAGFKIAGKKYDPFLDQVLELFMDAGEYIICVDGVVVKEEVDNMKGYLEKVRDNINKELQRNNTEEEINKRYQELDKDEVNRVLNKSGENHSNTASEKIDTNVETITWDRFMDHCSESTVEEMIKENVVLVANGPVDANDFMFAMSELSRSSQRKIIDDLLKSGFEITEDIVVEYFRTDGEDDVLSYLMENYKGMYSSDTVQEFIDCGCGPKTTKLVFSNYNGTFTFDNVIEIINYMEYDEPTIKKIFAHLEGNPTRDQIEEMLDIMDESYYPLIKPYFDKLPFSDRIDLRDIYNI